ncbi:MAG: small subunit ribosomal protein [Acidobacteriaceae bacterium]|nr:small subunit ribosomal protein [Acidobacteriaceae bacterium]
MYFAEDAGVSATVCIVTNRAEAQAIYNFFARKHMANHVSSLKRARQTERKTAVNRANKTRIRSSLRALREALQGGDGKAVAEQYRVTVSALDKSVQKGILHQNTASRYKSRLNARVKAVVTKKA